MRKTIAQRLTQAAATIPHFRLNVDCEIDALLDARERLNARSPKDGPGAYKLSVNDFIVKAMGLALQRVPDANATFTERGILIHKASDIGVAVAIDGGLFTPVIRAVEHKTLAQISGEMKDLAGRARRRRLAPHEYQGGTTAISNLGMFGIDSFDAVINPPHATILAVGRGEKRASRQGRQHRRRDDDELHALLRSPRGRRRAGRPAPGRVQGLHRGARHHADLRPGKGSRSLLPIPRSLPP